MKIIELLDVLMRQLKNIGLHLTYKYISLAQY